MNIITEHVVARNTTLLNETVENAHISRIKIRSSLFIT